MTRRQRRPGAGHTGSGNERRGGRRLNADSTTGMRVIEHHEPSAWLRQALAAAFADRAGEACPHAATARELATALWWPGRFVCAGCLPLLASPVETNWTCDRCGADAFADGITMLVAQHHMRGALDDTPPTWRDVSVIAGVCQACAAREVVDA